MPATIDITDVPSVDRADIECVMQHLIATGRGLAIIRGLSREEWDEIDTLIWSHAWSPARRLAVSLRFRSLIAAFAARRLKSLLLQSGFAVLVASVHVAAHLRFNARFGFAPQSLLSAVGALVEARVTATADRLQAQDFAAAA